MSFALTTQAMRERRKTVTRRLGWGTLKPGQLVQAVVKGMGLKKGEHPEKICVIRIVDVKREPLDAICLYDNDCELEGFPELIPLQFIRMFCEHNDCESWDNVTRIEFEYV